MPTRAFAVILDKSTGDTFEAIVNLETQSICSWEQLDTDKNGQAPLMIEEFDDLVKIVQEDSYWIAAVKKRGLTDEDIQISRLIRGRLGTGAMMKIQGRRLMRGVAFYRKKLTDNGYAHPLEGLVAIVDINERKVIELIDDGTHIPIPQAELNYDTPSLGQPRQDLKPLHIVQPEGVSFTVDDNWKVSWQNWEFRVGFTPREGLVIHQLGYNDKGKVRPLSTVPV
ncbi:copper amine oxidase [Acinetobacter johnsonii]|uniref:copper amine oxidase n=1 Tax=Acinetobacter johnsonii TaxID=40214 RepID=UPI00191D3DCD|nr:hypothetical protein [Acinetobacter johnsonii]QQV07926.1 hypothetical protein I6I49_01060 [Acinetobacter johnsonii]